METFERADTIIDTAFGRFELICFNFGPCEQDNILVLRNPAWVGVPVCRVQSACYTAEIFRSLDCDCHQQLERSLLYIAERGGLLVYMLCDGRGAGLLTKIRGLELTRVEGLDTADAYRKLGSPLDPRGYERVARVLLDLGVNDLVLLTNNPRKVAGLEARGLKVRREALEVEATLTSAPYLEAKVRKLGHLMSQFDKQ